MLVPVILQRKREKRDLKRLELLKNRRKCYCVHYKRKCGEVTSLEKVMRKEITETASEKAEALIKIVNKISKTETGFFAKVKRFFTRRG